MRLAWVTDVHLNFVKPDDRNRFYRSIFEAKPDRVLLGGDIAEAPGLLVYLHEFLRAVKVPVYFVLGNHDFYRSSIRNVSARVREMTTPELTWLTASGVQILSENTALIGDDGWADGRLGSYTYSPIELNDYHLIQEFLGLGKSERLRQLNALGDAAAERIKPKLREACATRQSIILLTHVPPFREACWYQGKPSDDDWVPHFASKAMGDAIIEVMDAHPECKLRVLCGHTHGAGFAQIRPNITVVTGGAAYGRPQLQTVVEV